MCFPDNIMEMLLLCTSSMSSTFKGSLQKIRTRFLDKKLLEEEDFENLLLVCETFQEWLQQAHDKFEEKKLQLDKDIWDLGEYR